MKTLNYLKNGALFLAIAIILLPFSSKADGQPQAKLKLQFQVVDSVKTCKVIVTADDKPVKDVAVKFLVKRTFGILPIGKPVTTNEEGEAKVTFPNDLPGGKTGVLQVVARLDDDATYGKAEVKDSVKWGKILAEGDGEWGERSLSASRAKAPMYLIIASNTIIIGIWLTLVYVVLQLFKIKKNAHKEQ